MTIKEATKYLQEELLAVYDEAEANVISGQVIMHLTNKKTVLELKESQHDFFHSAHQLEYMLEELKRARPLQYVLGFCYFYNSELRVDQDVLIPRPETEELVEWISQYIQQAQVPLSLMDVGTGSGCIPIALKNAHPHISASAIDNFPRALGLAKTNADEHNLKINFIEADILNLASTNHLPRYYDIIVSNPPYITISEMADMDDNVLAYEPHVALFVTNGDALQFYKAIEAFATIHLSTSGVIFLELNTYHANAIQDFYQQKNWQTELRKDMHGNWRMLKCRR